MLLFYISEVAGKVRELHKRFKTLISSRLSSLVSHVLNGNSQADSAWCSDLFGDIYSVCFGGINVWRYLKMKPKVYYSQILSLQNHFMLPLVPQSHLIFSPRTA